MSYKSLRIGDRIRIVAKPNDYSTMHKDTKSLYLRLIERGRSLRVAEWKNGNPWVNCQLKDKKGRIHYHSFAIINDGSWVKVKSDKIV